MIMFVDIAEVVYVYVQLTVWMKLVNFAPGSNKYLMNYLTNGEADSCFSTYFSFHVSELNYQALGKQLIFCLITRMLLNFSENN
jgi:hypothetical protein